MAFTLKSPSIMLIGFLCLILFRYEFQNVQLHTTNKELQNQQGWHNVTAASCKCQIRVLAMKVLQMLS